MILFGQGDIGAMCLSNILTLLYEHFDEQLCLGLITLCISLTC